MNYCGIDLAGVSSYAYVTEEKGRKLWAGPVETDKAALARLVKKFRSGGLAIVIEAGNQTAWVYEELMKLGAKVTVVNPGKVKLIAEHRSEAWNTSPMHRNSYPGECRPEKSLCSQVDLEHRLDVDGRHDDDNTVAAASCRSVLHTGANCHRQSATCCPS